MVLSNPDVDNALKYVKERYSQMKKKSDFRFHCMLFDIPERLRDYENNRVRTEFEAEVNRLQVPKCLMPKHPKWYDDMVEAQRRWIDANCGLPDAMKGCSEGFDSAKQHMMNYELHMRRYNEMWNPKKLIVDTDESFPDDFLIRGTWKKFHTQKEKKVNKLRLFKRIRILAGQFYAVVRALKWFGLIRWDEFDEQYEIVKPDGSGLDHSTTLPRLIKFRRDTEVEIKELKTRMEDRDDRIIELETETHGLENTIKNVEALVDFFFVKDYFNGSDSAPFSGRKFGDLIPRETAEKFEKLSATFGFSYSQNYVVEVHYTSGDNALEHKATIARYEKEVANFRKTLK